MMDRLEEMLSQQSGETRAEKLHAVGLHLRETSAYVRLLLCEVSYTMTAATRRTTLGRPSPGLWHEIRRADGTPYRTQHDYLRALWGTRYSRSALSARKTLGQALARFPLEQREWLRRSLAEVGLMKALSLGALLERAKDAEQIGTWLSRAADPMVSTHHLRRWVAEAVGTARTQPQANGPTRIPRCPTCHRPWKPQAVRGAMPIIPVAGDALARHVAVS